MNRRSIFIITLLLLTHMQMKAQESKGRYAMVNGLNIYYEIHGEGKPLVLLHGGGSTIGTNFGRILPELARKHQVIAVEAQAHGHTPDRDQPSSFEQDADDVAALLETLGIEKADFLGFSNGGTTCLQIAIRHPHLVNKLILASTIYKREGMPEGFFESMEHATLEHMPKVYQDAFLAINPDTTALQAMFDRDRTRMLNFWDIPEEDIRRIQAPALVLNGDSDIRVEHALELSRTLSDAKLAILPGGHGDYIGEILSAGKPSSLPALVVAMIEDFLAGGK